MREKSFYNDKIPKEGSQYVCLSVILLDFVFRTGKNYYPQVFDEEHSNEEKYRMDVFRFYFFDVSNIHVYIL